MSNDRGHLSIGEVLSLVQEEFPDITISKIRFLESQGLLDPERTPSGYRKFYESDIDRLQWILGQQRDNFLPLKVIRERLDEWDATGNRPEPDADVDPDVGRTEQRHAAAALAASSADEVAAHRPAPEPDPVAPASDPTAGPGDDPSGDRDVPGPDRAAVQEAAPMANDDVTPAPTSGGSLGPAAGEPAPVVDEPAPAPAAPDDGRMTAEELALRANVQTAIVHELEGFSMITSSRVGPDTYYGPDALEMVEACRPFLERGIEVRHLRMYKIAAEREAGVFEQLVMPLLKQRNPDARARAVGTVNALGDAGEDLHRLLLRDALRRSIG